MLVPQGNKTDLAVCNASSEAISTSAFIDFGSQSSITTALRELEGALFDGKTIELKVSKVSVSEVFTPTIKTQNPEDQQDET